MYKVLIVDDERTVREGLKAMVATLDRWQWVGEASNGSKAIEQVKRNQPDLILTDIRMPEIDGLLLLEKIREFDTDTLVVFLTGYPDFQYAQKALRYGAFDYLLKPTRAKDISEVLLKAEKEIDHIGEMKKRHNHYDQVIRQYETWISEKVAREFIYGGNTEHFDWSELSFFRMCRSMAVVTLILEPVGSPDDQPEMEEIPLQLENNLQTSCLVFRDGHHEWILLLGSKDEDHPINARELLQKLPYDLETTMRPFGLDWKAGIGETVPLENASLSYDQSKFAAYHASPEKPIVHYSAISGYDKSLLVVPIELEVSMLKCVKKGSPAEALTLFLQIEPYYRRMTLLELAKHALKLQIQLQGCLSSLHEIDREQTELKLPELPPKRAETIIQWLWEFIKTSAEQIQQQSQKQMNHVVQRALNTVRQYYYTELKLGDIAHKMGINPNYLSTLFKQETGVSFSDYLSHYRVEKSKTLLKNPELKIYEVAQEIGYTDGRHYSQVFRKLVGMTPFEYRNRNGVPTAQNEDEQVGRKG